MNVIICFPLLFCIWKMNMNQAKIKSRISYYYQNYKSMIQFRFENREQRYVADITWCSNTLGCWFLGNMWKNIKSTNQDSLYRAMILKCSIMEKERRRGKDICILYYYQYFSNSGWIKWYPPPKKKIKEKKNPIFMRNVEAGKNVLRRQNELKNTRI